MDTPSTNYVLLEGVEYESYIYSYYSSSSMHTRE